MYYYALFVFFGVLLVYALKSGQIGTYGAPIRRKENATLYWALLLVASSGLIVLTYIMIGG